MRATIPFLNRSKSTAHKLKSRNAAIPIGPSNRAGPPMDVLRHELRRRLPRCARPPRFPSGAGLGRLRAHSYTGPSAQCLRRRHRPLPLSRRHFRGTRLGLGSEYRVTARPRTAFFEVSPPPFPLILKFLLFLFLQ